MSPAGDAAGEDISSHPSDAPLSVHDLTVAYHKKPVLWGVDFEIPKGNLVGIVGPNGAGKSTLIKAAMGLLPLSSGWVEVAGRACVFFTTFPAQREANSRICLLFSRPHRFQNMRGLNFS